MQINKDLLDWAESWHWPQLVLSEREKTCIQAGEHNWRTWADGADQRDVLLAWQRIDKWQKLIESKAS